MSPPPGQVRKTGKPGGGSVFDVGLILKCPYKDTAKIRRKWTESEETCREILSIFEILKYGGPF